MENFGWLAQHGSTNKDICTEFFLCFHYLSHIFHICHIFHVCLFAVEEGTEGIVGLWHHMLTSLSASFLNITGIIQNDSFHLIHSSASHFFSSRKFICSIFFWLFIFEFFPCNLQSLFWMRMFLSHSTFYTLLVCFVHERGRQYCISRRFQS